MSTWQIRAIGVLVFLAAVFVIWALHDVRKRGGWSFRDNFAVVAIIVTVIGIVAAWPHLPPEPIVWRHNPALPAPHGYPGEKSYRALPCSDDSQWKECEVSVSNSQILLVAGYAGNLQSVGAMGGPSQCFVLVTRGPFQAKIGVQAAAVEIHEVDPGADTLTWAAQKAQDVRATCSSCASGVDVWAGR